MKGVVFFALFGLFSNPAFGQNAPGARTSALYGMNEAQIGERFGRPDDVRKKSEDSVEWIYGQSTVFFIQGKVSAWSDAGELAQRERLSALQSDKALRDDSLSDQWVNPWTPPGRAAPPTDSLTDVIDE